MFIGIFPKIFVRYGSCSRRSGIRSSAIKEKQKECEEEEEEEEEEEKKRFQFHLLNMKRGKYKSLITYSNKASVLNIK
jgi:hypothetical protein